MIDRQPQAGSQSPARCLWGCYQIVTLQLWQQLPEATTTLTLVNDDDAFGSSRRGLSLKPPVLTNMLNHTKHLLAALTVAGITAAALPASAATFVAGDLLLGFRATGGTGASSNLVVNLGQADTIYRDASSTITNIADLNSLLVSTYGANWADRSDLSWGAVAVRSNSSVGAAVDGDPVRTNYVTAAQNTLNPGTQSSSAWNITGGTGRADISNAIAGLNTAYSGAAGTTSAVIDTSTANSWSLLIADNNFKVGGPIEGSNASGIDATGLDLYRILNTNTGASPTGTVGLGSYEGTLTISSAGVVGFSVAAVPEPSRAVLAALGLGGLLLRRRRSAKA